MRRLRRLAGPSHQRGGLDLVAAVDRFGSGPLAFVVDLQGTLRPVPIERPDALAAIIGEAIAGAT